MSLGGRNAVIDDRASVERPGCDWSAGTFFKPTGKEALPPLRDVPPPTRLKAYSTRRQKRRAALNACLRRWKCLTKCDWVRQVRRLRSAQALKSALDGLDAL